MTEVERRRLEEELAKVKQNITASESMHGMVSDESLAVILTELREKQAVIETQLAGKGGTAPSSPDARSDISQVDGSVIEGGVQAGGDVVGRDKITYNYHHNKEESQQVKWREAYLERLLQVSGVLSLAGIDPKAADDERESRLHLSEVYTALLTTTTEERERLPLEHKPEPVSAIKQLNRHHYLVLLGDPGSGKSTFVDFVTLCLAGAGLGHEQFNLDLLTAPLPDDKGEASEARQPWQHGALLPMPVVLRDLAARGLPAPGAPARAAHLWAFIEEELKARTLTHCLEPLHQTLLTDGGILLLDGLDEVPEAQQRRPQIKEMVLDFVTTFAKVRILVTSRTYAYQQQAWRLPGFSQTVLAPFSQGQIRRFVQRWYAHMGLVRHYHPDEVQGRAALLQRAIFSNARLYELAQRPLLLTLMASLHAWRGGSLPERREALYADTVDLLLDWWEKPKVVRDVQGKMVMKQPSLAEWLKVDRQKVLALLQHLAYEAHAGQPELTGTADILEDRLVGGLLRLNRNEVVNLTALVNYLSQRAGLLVPRGVAVYTFPHRTFQEYLAACYLTDETYPDNVAQLARQDPNRWREVALLAGAKAGRGSVSTIWSLVEALCYEEPNQEAEDCWGAHLAGQLLWETLPDREDIRPRHQAKVERVRRWLVHLLSSSQLPAVERVAAGGHLAQLGDPQPEVMTLEGMQFCYVPPGPFVMGDDDSEYEDERPQHQLDIPYPYWLGRLPVTNAQYAAFVADGGREAYDLRTPFTLPNHPVVGVDWFQARDFCAWLTQKWQASGLLPEDWMITLPSEAEWEKAARGGIVLPDEWVVRQAGAWSLPTLTFRDNPWPKRTYPWGDNTPEAELANYKASQIGSPSAVGCYRENVSPYGCVEMAGNVREWTGSIWGASLNKPDYSYPYQANDGREDVTKVEDRTAMIVRGGAYNSSRNALRCAYRLRYYALDWYDYQGLRLCARPHSSRTDGR